jgi:hypothetical protein
MKVIKIALLSILALTVNLSWAGGEVKEVCSKEVKKGKEVEVCKKIKVHKKLDGTKVPPK